MKRISALLARLLIESKITVNDAREIGAEFATLRATLEGLRESVETEWYNGNVDEGARDRILATAKEAGE